MRGKTESLGFRSANEREAAVSWVAPAGISTKRSHTPVTIDFTTAQERLGSEHISTFPVSQKDASLNTTLLKLFSDVDQLELCSLRRDFGLVTAYKWHQSSFAHRFALISHEIRSTPEWQRAYINYRLLKKRITAIRRANGEENRMESPTSSQVNVAPTSEASTTQSQGSMQPPVIGSSTFASNNNSKQDGAASASFPDLVPSSSIGDRPPLRNELHRAQTAPSMKSPQPRREPSFSAPPFTTMSLNRLASTKNSKSTRLSRRAKSFTKLVNAKSDPYSEIPLKDLMPLLTPIESAFFTTLDAELEKVESFYVAREKDTQNHTRLLGQQLNELYEHRKLFLATHPSTTWPSAINPAAIFKFNAKIHEEEDTSKTAVRAAKGKLKSTAKTGKNLTPSGSQDTTHNRNTSTETDHGSGHLDPDEYFDARHKLKKAVLEHYRGLEMLQNYRILNITAIRKSLKKFEKVTKVDKTALASEVNVRAMMDEMEEMYALRFAHGDKKKATIRLRSGPQHKSHHISTFWSGYQQSTRDQIPGWDALLLVYAVLFVPVVFSLLVGLNLLVWARSRINYVFIFEFDLRTRLDHREYFEARKLLCRSLWSLDLLQTPSILLATLVYAFWLSFARIGAPSISPTIWPLVWLAFTVVLLLDPLPILFKPSRYWLLRNIGKLLTSGSRRVEVNNICSIHFPGDSVEGGKYAAGIDFLMDWSILRLNAKYPLLRSDLVYTNHIYLYYIAILSNILIRFIWVLYIPIRGPDPMLRAFIAASFEMLRRVQWNFYRLENEHLGNVDQYRVTREVPLPYSLENPTAADPDDDDDNPRRRWLTFPVRRSSHVVPEEA
ncbi:EXS family protein/ERD1/XPR1/SYG1 family protein [Mycena rebaudengoi]|nr:EXS family protein/ERD1/XPR1/SYG1 family protein [Mycena rebaudengoi]